MTGTKRLLTLIHILLWTYAVVMFSWEVFVDGHPFRPKGVLIGLYVFYAQLFIFQKYLNKKRYKQYFLYFLVILLTGHVPYIIYVWAGGGALSELVTYWFTGDYWAEVTFFLFNSLIIAVIQTLILNTIKKEELQKQAVNSELVYLKSQINPHFLFNTLNNIHTLVYMRAPAAPEAVLRLSSLMRYMLYESNANAVPLSIELNYLKDFIGLQQLRYKSRDIVDFQVEGDIGNCQVAPLLFIHLLENTYKHSPAKLETGSIKVRVSVKGDQVEFSFQNPIGRKTNNLLEEPGGIGLANVQKRLQLLYPDQHSLQITKTDDLYRLVLKINIKTGNERKTQLLYNR
ncbi:MAG TPA: histidine kinase [Chryseosolibacter sp.]|nr:histidine kinase [Chryseosolibacter sp.]